jgi:hypothetical protein
MTFNRRRLEPSTSTAFNAGGVAICVAVRSRTGHHQTTWPFRIRRRDGTQQHPLGLDGRYGRDC